MNENLESIRSEAYRHVDMFLDYWFKDGKHQQWSISTTRNTNLDWLFQSTGHASSKSITIAYAPGFRLAYEWIRGQHAIKYIKSDATLIPFEKDDLKWLDANGFVLGINHTLATKQQIEDWIYD